MADAADLKSAGRFLPCGFESRRRHTNVGSSCQGRLALPGIRTGGAHRPPLRDGGEVARHQAAESWTPGIRTALRTSNAWFSVAIVCWGGTLIGTFWGTHISHTESRGKLGRMGAAKRDGGEVWKLRKTSNAHVQHSTSRAEARAALDGAAKYSRRVNGPRPLYSTRFEESSMSPCRWRKSERSIASLYDQHDVAH